jgi:hypothetical protein
LWYLLTLVSYTTNYVSYRFQRLLVLQHPWQKQKRLQKTKMGDPNAPEPADGGDIQGNAPLISCAAQIEEQ